MNKYAVAVMSLFENINKVFIVEAAGMKDAILLAIRQFHNQEDVATGKNLNDEDYMIEWYKSLEHMSIDAKGVIESCMNGEIAVSMPVSIDN